MKDANGQPVSDAELAVVVVDEAILALTNYQMTDPISIFYSERGSGVMSVYGRTSIVLANPQALAGTGRSQRNMMRTAWEAERPWRPWQCQRRWKPRLHPKRNLQPVPNPPPSTCARTSTPWRPSLRTSAPARMVRRVLFIRLPDNLTRYRVMVVAVDNSGRQFGMGESNITARLPLMVRPSAPRFLNFGDKFELPVVLQNQTDSPMTVDVVARATNLELDQAGLRVTVPANDRIEVRFPASTQKAGTARIQIAAISGDLCRCRGRGTAGLHAGHHRSLCHLRRDRRGRDRPARAVSHRRLPAVRRAGDQHLLHRAAGAHRCRAVSGLLSLRMLRAAGLAHPGGGRPARCADRLRSRRPARRPRKWRRRSRATSRACRACRTTTAASPTGGADSSRSRSTPSTWRMPWSAPGKRDSMCPAEMLQGALNYLRDIESSLSLLVQPADPLDAERVCPVRAQPDPATATRKKPSAC